MHLTMAQTVLTSYIERIRYENALSFVPAGVAAFSAIILAFRASGIIGRSKSEPNLVSWNASVIVEFFLIILLGSVIRVQRKTCPDIQNLTFY